MAFEHKLEADRIDDFNFFSAFVRVPLLIIGGILGVDGSSSSSSLLSSSSALVPASDSDETNNILNNENETDDNSDTTTDNDYTTTTTTTLINQRRQPSNISSMGRPSQRNSSEYIPDCYNNDDDNNNNNNNNNHGMKRTKKTMSWSDESGLPLVAYDESASHHHEPISPYASSTVTTSRILKPTKSVIKQSRSSECGSSSSCQEPSTNTLPLSSSASSSSRYIPNMNPRKGNNGLIVPTRPYGSHHHQSKCTENQSNTNGSEMSPQWGWYINTTPPTPELYHSRSSSKSSFSSGGGGGNSGSIKPINEQLDTITSSSLLSCSPNSNTIVDGNTCQNQVFKNLKNSNAPIHGWTSIPI